MLKTTALRASASRPFLRPRQLGILSRATPTQFRLLSTKSTAESIAEKNRQAQNTSDIYAEKARHGLHETQNTGDSLTEKGRNAFNEARNSASDAAEKGRNAFNEAKNSASEASEKAGHSVKQAEAELKIQKDEVSKEINKDKAADSDAAYTERAAAAARAAGDKAKEVYHKAQKKWHETAKE